MASAMCAPRAKIPGKNMSDIDSSRRGVFSRFLVLLVLLAGCKSTAETEAGPVELLAYVGSASGPAVEELARSFTEDTGIALIIEQGGSGAMLSKLQLAGRGDIYLPGSSDYMIKAEQQQQIDPETIRTVAYLVPAINVPAGNPMEIRGLGDLARPGVKVGIADPYSVCVGAYAVEVVENAGMAEAIRANVVTHAHSCSATANLVALGSVDAILGWRVFGEWYPERIETIPLPPDAIPRLGKIPVAVASRSENVAESARFIEYLIGPTGREVFSEHGYVVTEEQARVFAPDAGLGGSYDPPAGW